MKINAYELGIGNPIVFLHGWGGNHMMMAPHVMLLSHDYRCINLDLFGFGKSDEIEDYQSFNDYVDALHAYLISIDVLKPIFVAHSFGARIAILYANKYDVQALILTGAAGIRPPLSLEKKIKQFLYKHHLYKKGSVDYERSSGFLRKVLVEVVNKDLSEEIKNILCPTLLIWGNMDTETPLWMAKKMKEYISNSELILFKGEDHFAYYHECERFCFIVKEFLMGHEL